MPQCSNKFLQWYMEHMFLLFCRMTSEVPLVLREDDALPAEDLEEWLCANYPDKCLSPPGTLAAQLAKHLQLEEAVLCAHAHDELIGVDPTLKKMSDSWLAGLVVSCEEYAMELTLVGSPTDGLFPLLVANFTKLDITVAHHQGLWSSKVEAQGSIEDDIFPVFTDCGFSRLLPGVPDLSF